jgi:hypothetical protein
MPAVTVCGLFAYRLRSDESRGNRKNFSIQRVEGGPPQRSDFFIGGRVHAHSISQGLPDAFTQVVIFNGEHRECPAARTTVRTNGDFAAHNDHIGNRCPAKIARAQLGPRKVVRPGLRIANNVANALVARL